MHQGSSRSIAAGGNVDYGTMAARPPPQGRVNPFDGEQDYPGSCTNRGVAAHGDSHSDIKDSIAGDIIKISSSVSTLERALKKIGTTNDSAELREKMHEGEQTMNAVIKRTATSLKHLASQCSRSDRTEFLQCERLMSEFKEATRRYTDMQKKVADKVRVSPPVAAAAHKQPLSADLIGWSDGDSAAAPTAAGGGGQQQQLLLQEQTDTELQLLREREEQIRQLEGNILDVNDIFRQLGMLVHEQGAVVDSIEANVESASSQVESGNDELRKAAVYQMGARKKKCCLIVILVTVIAIIILVIVLIAKLHK